MSYKRKKPLLKNLKIRTTVILTGLVGCIVAGAIVVSAPEKDADTATLPSLTPECITSIDTSEEVAQEINQTVLVPFVTVTATNDQETVLARYEYEEEAVVVAKVVYCEARGVQSITEQANVIWTILNRVDAGYGSDIIAVATAPHQFAYRDDAPTVDDYGRNLVELAQHIICCWAYGDDSTFFRTLPEDYFYFRGHDGHNWFFSSYAAFSQKDYDQAYDYSLGYLSEEY